MMNNMQYNPIPKIIANEVDEFHVPYTAIAESNV